MNRVMLRRRVLLVIGWCCAVTQPIGAQASQQADSLGRAPTARHVATVGVATVAATAATMPFDRLLARRFRSAVRREPGLDRVAQVVGTVGDPGALLMGGTLLLTGRLAHRPVIADLGLHATEAMIVSGTVTQALKHLVGRMRPYAAGIEHPFEFRAFEDVSGNRSLPSGHTTAAFTFAMVADRELAQRAYLRSHRRTRWLVGTALYGAATLTGVSRMVEEAHWASDVVAGAGIGMTIGWWITRRQHQHAPTRVERWLRGY